jgi:hypothetical protein
MRHLIGLSAGIRGGRTIPKRSGKGKADAGATALTSAGPVGQGSPAPLRFWGISMLSRRLLVALLACAVLTGPVHAAEAVNGLNVTLITYKGDPTYSNGTFKARGHGRWIEKTSEGTHNFVEKSKSASKMTLWDSDRKATVIINVKIGGTLSWIWNGSPVTPYAKITKLEKP